MNVRLAWLILVLIVAAGVMLRMPAVGWLADAADTKDYSFHPDDQRFVLAALDIKAPNPDGYPQGMVTQLYVAHWVVNRFTHATVLQVLHAITILYAGLSILLTYVIARAWNMSRGVALLGAAFLSVAPLALVQSNFGTADITAMFYFYAALLAGGQYLRTQKQLWFVVLCALTGMAIAVKFFIPLFAPLALVLAVQRKGERVVQALTAAFIVVASFQALSFFEFTPWDLKHLFYMLRDDNVVIGAAVSDIVAGGPVSQLGRYSWGLVSAVGIPCAILFVVGLVRWSRGLRESVLRIRRTVLGETWQSLVTPASRIHAERHVLVFVPMICIAAAQCLFWLFGTGKRAIALRAVAIVAILGIQTSEAVAIESLYRTDVRNSLADWSAQQVSEGRQVVTLARFSKVRGSTYIATQDPQQLDRSAYIVTCDFEYARYLPFTKAGEIFHPMGGQERLDFFRDVFVEGTSEYGIVRAFTSEPRGVLLRLVDAEILPLLGTFVPRRCYALGRENKLPDDAQQAVRADVVGAGRGW